MTIPEDTNRGRARRRAGRIGRALRPFRRSRGQSIVELALILPIFIVLLAAGADLARLFHSQVAIESAARAGVLEAATNPTSFVQGQACNVLTNRVTCAVLTESSGSFMTIAPADITLTCNPTPCVEALGNEVRVTVVGHFSLMTPILSAFLGGSSVTFSQSATAQLAVRPTVASPTPTPTAGPRRRPRPHRPRRPTRWPPRRRPRPWPRPPRPRPSASHRRPTSRSRRRPARRRRPTSTSPTCRRRRRSVP
jgi:Flp pilus assembly protein TadG